MAKVQITLNGKRIEADTAETILGVTKRNGVFIPTLCDDARLEPIGSCRVCLVKVEGAKSFVPSCSTKVSEGMVILTEDAEVRQARRLALTLLISDHFGDCVSPCSLSCPAHIDIQGYIALIKGERYSEAVKLIKEKNPMPLTIGRICPHPCETVCRRNKVDESIAINNLKRFAADHDSALETPYEPELEEKKKEKIGIIGAGPAGLSCAYYLAVKGYGVSIFEKNESAGGMLRYGIPDYRLPKGVLESEFNSILKLGVRIHLGMEFGSDISVEDLKKDGFSALFLGIGAQKSIGLRIEGEKDERVLGGIQFLHDMATGKRFDFKGKRIIIVGGGNTAMDAARTSIRLGAGEVKVLYRRTRKEMPANDIEIAETEEEGIIFEYLAAPVKIMPYGELLCLECIRMELGKPDASGRRRPVPIEGSNYTIETHFLISAIGQRTEVTSITDPEMISVRDTIKANLQTGATHDDFIFAGGDCVTGAATAIEAIAGGRRAAFAIDEYLQTGVKPEQERWEFNISKGTLDEIPASYYELYEKDGRAVMPREESKARVKDFREIEHGLSDSEALKEAARCLECGCTEGFSCLLRDHSTAYRVDTSEIVGEKNHYQEYNNLLAGHPPIFRDENKCVKCGICVRICDEVWGLNIFGYTKRGFHTEISPYFGLELKDTECDFCGQCASSCPTGALSLNTYLPKPGPFKVRKVSGRCINCSLGCELEYCVYENMILRTTSVPMLGENEGNLCVRGRFGYGYLLSPWRSLSFMECVDGSRGEISREDAVQRAVNLLKSTDRPLILTSTHLSNEEYEKINEICDHLNGADVFHIPYDFSEYLPKEAPLLGKSKSLESLLHGIPLPSLSDISTSEALVLLNFYPGRSYPILEMAIRNAVKAGAKLYVLNENAIRLDDYAESIFRINNTDRLEFLKLTGAVALQPGVSTEHKIKDYFKKAPDTSDLLATNGINGKKIGEFVKCMVKSKRTVFITDEERISLDELEAFIHLVGVFNGSAQLLLMQKGTNPQGALSTMRQIPNHFSITRETLADYDGLLLYKLPDLFAPYKLPVIHIGFSPFAHYGKQALFIPSSSLLESGGTTYLYNGQSARLPVILKKDQKIDNTQFLESVVQRLKNV